MRGTGYAIAEIIWWMLAAAAIGGIIGWILRYWIGGGRSRKEAEAKMEAQRGRYAEISEELGVWKVKGEGLIKELEAKTAELESLREHRAELESSLAGAVKDAAADLESRLAAVTGELSSLQEAHAACGVVADGHTGRIAALESQLAELEVENAELRSRTVTSNDNRGLGADLEALAAAEENDVDASAQLSLTSPNTAMAKAAAPPTRFGTAGANHKDDLKVISGIGPKLEGVLNSYGIESWEQLADLSDAEVERVDEGLEDFPGRIQRDEWVAQARDLVKRFPDKAKRPNRTTFLNEPPA